MPIISPTERESASNTWLYLTAFQHGFVSVIEPISGHALQQIPVDAEQAGMAVSPDGRRLYVVDGIIPNWEGQLRVFDTATWLVIHLESVPHRARRLGGNPIALSPDGRWLVVSFYDYEGRTGWRHLFDTERLEFLSEGTFEIDNCRQDLQSLVGVPGSAEVYVQCQGFVAVLSAEDLSLLRGISSPTPFERDGLGWARVGGAALAVSPDADRLYGLYPVMERKVDMGHRVVEGTDLLLYAWNTKAREEPQVVTMSDQASVPLATAGRGDAGYLVASYDGQRLFVAWEQMLWSLDAESLRVVGGLSLPAPVDGMVQSLDGRELYLLPSTSGDLSERARHVHGRRHQIGTGAPRRGLASARPAILLRRAGSSTVRGLGAPFRAAVNHRLSRTPAEGLLLGTSERRQL